MIIQDKNIEQGAAVQRAEAPRTGVVESSNQIREDQPEPKKTVAEEGGEEVRLDKESAEKLLFEVEEHLASKGVALKFCLSEDSDTLQVEVRDAESEKVIRKIPDDELVRLSKSIKDMVGALMDKPC